MPASDRPAWSPPSGLVRIGQAPLLLVGDGLIAPDLIAALRELDPSSFDPDPDPRTGTSVELAATRHPAAGALIARLSDLLDVPGQGAAIRWRRYEDGQAHPPHLDDYALDGRRLALTALVALDTPQGGGETFFSRAWPEPIAVAPRAGRLVVWLDVNADGRPDASSEHAGLRVVGVKTTATLFLYLRPSEIGPLVHRLRAIPALDPPAGVRVGGPCLHLIPTRAAPETTAWLAAACAARGVGVRLLDPRRTDWLSVGRLSPGHLLYRAETTELARRLEALLVAPGVGHVHADDDGPVRPIWHDVALRRAGLPLPRLLPVHDADPASLGAAVERLGGFPVVARFPGGSGGVGVVRCDSLPALASLVDWALSRGEPPDLVALVEGGEVWRAIVVDDRCVAAYPNPVREGDFRSGAPEDPEDYHRAWPVGLDSLAVAAAVAVRARVAGVDVIASPDGRMVVLEANAPCYWGHAQEHGHDVAGAIVDALLATAGARAD